MNITYNSDTVSMTEAVNMDNYINSGYTHPIEDLEFTTEVYEEFITDLKSKYDFKEYNFSESKKNAYKQFICDEFVIFMNGVGKSVWCSIFSKDVETSYSIFKTYKKYQTLDDQVKVYTDSYFIDRGSLNKKTRSLKREELEYISDLYYPYINNDVMYKQFFNLQENILILAGKPGIGKSKMASSILKYAAENPDIIPYDKTEFEPTLETQYIRVAYVKSNSVLADDSFWRELEDSRYDFCLIDDLDFFLTKRSEENSGDEVEKNRFLNQFLSYTDGVEKHRTKFIITTNQPFNEIDTALLRKGRLFDILELRDLSKAEGLAIWLENNLDEKVFDETYSDRILPADLGSDISRRLNDKISVALDVYCNEEGISKIKEVQNKKDIGF